MFVSFNPRTHTGSLSCGSFELFRQCLLVSIHAPTRGATYRHLRRQRGDPVSIHAPTRGATIGITDRVSSEERVSIHAPTRGATYVMVTPFLMDVSFNPRTHTGCDDKYAFYCGKKEVSIHAPTRGATLGFDHCIKRL